MSHWIPESERLDVRPLARVFESKSATYKFFWFLSILDILQKDGTTEISFSEIAAHMYAKAWCPNNFYKLSFGRGDSFDQFIPELAARLQIKPYDQEIEIIKKLTNCDAKDKTFVKKAFNRILGMVPYRFLSPWIKNQDQQTTQSVMQRSQEPESDCLYALYKNDEKELCVRLNPKWCGYLIKNYRFLIEFTYRQLTLFIQLKNPNVPNISNKLFLPTTRPPLTKQREFWKSAIELQGKTRCIYTGQELTSNTPFDLDHFLPRRYTAHDRLWNLVPMINESMIDFGCIRLNSQKGSRIPDLDYFLPKLANEHFKAIQCILARGRRYEILENFCDLGFELKDLRTVSKENFYQAYEKMFKPATLVAYSLGFESWDYPTRTILKN